MELLFPDAAAPLVEASDSLLLLLDSFLARLGVAFALALPAFCVRARLWGMAIEEEWEKDGDGGDGGARVISLPPPRRFATETTTTMASAKEDGGGRLASVVVFERMKIHLSCNCR